MARSYRIHPTSHYNGTGHDGSDTVSTSPPRRAQREKTYHFLVKLFLNLCWRLFSQNSPSWAWNMKCETRTVHSLTLALLPQPLCVVWILCSVRQRCLMPSSSLLSSGQKKNFNFLKSLKLLTFACDGWLVSYFCVHHLWIFMFQKF